MSKILTDIGYFASFISAVMIRLPAAVITLVMHIAVLCAMKRFIFKIREYITKEE